MASDGPETTATPPGAGTWPTVESKTTPGPITDAENWSTKVIGAGKGPANGWGSDIMISLSGGSGLSKGGAG